MKGSAPVWADAPARDRGADTPSLRTVTFNIRSGLGWDGRHSWPFRRRALVERILTLDADILCLQEVHGFQLRYLRRRLKAYGTVGRPRGRWTGERAPIFYRTAHLDVLEAGTRWLSPSPGVPGSRFPGSSLPRAVTWARLRDRRAGHSLWVANTHLDHRSEAMRRRGARLLSRWLDAASPTLLCGDFNETPDGPGVRALLAAGLHDPLAHLGGRGEAAATYHGFAGHGAGARIDLVLLSGHWVCERAYIDRVRSGGIWPSDHWPVSVDARPLPAPSPT